MNTLSKENEQLKCTVTELNYRLMENLKEKEIMSQNIENLKTDLEQAVNKIPPPEIEPQTIPPIQHEFFEKNEENSDDETNLEKAEPYSILPESQLDYVPTEKL